MSKELASDEKQVAKRLRPIDKAPEKKRPAGLSPNVAGMLKLQQQAGNRAVQRLLAQRSSNDGSFDLDQETAGRIQDARGGGQALDSTVQKQMGESMGHDFSGVQVHNSPESDDLNRQLNAKAFTTGQDIFFRQDTYDPGSSSGKELIAHELTHVVQQSSGQVPGSGSGMTVRPPGDHYEQEADAVAKNAINTGVQRQADEEELQMKAVQRQEEEELQMKADEVQRQEDEEELQMKTVQRQEEEELQMKAVQRQEEEELQMKADEVQRQEDEEELQL